MTRIDRARFFASIRKTLFAGRLQEGQVGGINAILDAWEREMAGCDRRFLAYMLATVYHETARTMAPVRETLAASDDEAIAILDAAWARGKLRWVKKRYWRRDGDGKTWLGRGLVQLTHKQNYLRLGAAIGVDLVADPGRAMAMDVAVAILFAGMVDGLFTGRRLADCFNPARADWTAARRIITGPESAARVAGHALAFDRALALADGTHF
jgi:hypothetical protein